MLLPASGSACAPRMRYLFILLMLLATAGMNLFPEQLVLHDFTSPEKDPQLEDILYLSIGVSLSEAGFSSTRAPDSSYAYLLRIAYESGDTATSLGLSLYDADPDKMLLAQKELILNLDYSMDRVLSEAVQALLSEAGIQAVETDDAFHSSAIEGLFTRPAPEVQDPEAELKLPQAETVSGVFNIYVAAAPGVLLFTGQASDYFHYGAMAALSAGNRFAYKQWILSPGLRLTVNRAFNNDDVEGGPLYLSTFGAELQAESIHIQNPVRLTLLASGGAAVLSVAGGSRTLHKSVLYFDAGAAILFPFGKGFSAAGELRSMLIFEPGFTMNALVPALSVRKEF